MLISIFLSANLKNRCKYVSGSFLEEIPRNSDLYILKAILHGKNDNQAKQILQHFRSSMHPLKKFWL